MVPRTLRRLVIKTLHKTKKGLFFIKFWLSLICGPPILQIVSKNTNLLTEQPFSAESDRNLLIFYKPRYLFNSGFFYLVFCCIYCYCGGRTVHLGILMYYLICLINWSWLIQEKLITLVELARPTVFENLSELTLI